MTTATNDKQPGKCAQLHAMWDDAAHGEPLPRDFMVQMGVASGFNPSTARTQAQRWLSKFTDTRVQTQH